jgi:hypothetical protein
MPERKNITTSSSPTSKPPLPTSKFWKWLTSGKSKRWSTTNRRRITKLKEKKKKRKEKEKKRKRKEKEKKKKKRLS